MAGKFLKRTGSGLLAVAHLLLKVFFRHTFNGSFHDRDIILGSHVGSPHDVLENALLLFRRRDLFHELLSLVVNKACYSCCAAHVLTAVVCHQSCFQERRVLTVAFWL